MDPVDLLPLVVPHLSRGAVAIPDPRVAAAAEGLLAQGSTVRPGPLERVGDGEVEAVLLLSGELADAGVAGPTLLSEAVRACRPGGVVAAATPSAVHQQVTGAANARPAVPAAELSHMLAHRGLELLLEAAPGAAATLADRPWRRRDDLELDRLPGLRDAGPTVLVVGRTPRSAGERSTHFFASIARKILSASVVCRDPDGRILLVFDSFRGVWTLPGGLVDAKEDPAEAAVREALEEGGVPVALDGLAGVFAHPYPDRVQLIYLARPTADVTDPEPIHTHEIAEARWATRDEADHLLNPDMRRRLGLCLEQPGGTWMW